MASRSKLFFQSAEKARDNITKEHMKEISGLYAKWSDDLGKRAEYYKTKQNASSWLQEQNMRQLQAQLEERSKEIANNVYDIIKDSIYMASDAVIQANARWLDSLKVTDVNSAYMAFQSLPQQTVERLITGQIYDTGWSLSVERLITGQIYDTGWSLSRSIWGDNEKTLKDIYTIVAEGTAKNMSVYEISKMLEQYVDPKRAKQWNLKMLDGKYIYKRSIDYNAQRLVRTLTQHGYQTTFKAVTEKNPFVIDYIWWANGSRACDLCKERDGQHFKKEDLPLDHPNGMCTMEANEDKDLIDKLADWLSSPDGTYPEIDEFAKQFSYVPE